MTESQKKQGITVRLLVRPQDRDLLNNDETIINHFNSNHPFLVGDVSSHIFGKEITKDQLKEYHGSVFVFYDNDKDVRIQL